MSARDFLPTLTPQSWEQLGVNTIYAAAAGAFIAREIDIPGEYGALGLGGAYALVGFSNSPTIIINSACNSLERGLGGRDSLGDVFGNVCHGGVAGWLGKTGYEAAKIDWEQIKAWWNQDKSKTGWTPINSAQDCTVQKLLQDPKTYFQRCHK